MHLGKRSSVCFLLLMGALIFGAPLPAAAQAPQAEGSATAASSAAVDYIVGPQDVLTITSYDQADLTGKFTVETDGTFTFPLIGRFRAGGLTLRQVEEGLKKSLTDEGFFRKPQITVSVDQYRSQKVFVEGEVRTPGSYALSGGMSLVEVLAKAGSTLPTASGEVVIVHVTTGNQPAGPTLPGADEAHQQIVRVDLRALQSGATVANAALRDGDTIFVPRAENVYVYGQVKNPGAYPLQRPDITVMQALSLAGGMTDRGADGRIKIVRFVDGAKKEIKVSLTDSVKPGDTITVPERFF
jgi:polysaccharide export outer membrane protein